MQKFSRQLMAFVLTLMIALLLVACGESSTAILPAVSTAPASTTSGQAITEAAITTLTGTTNAVVTTGATTGSSHYPNAKPLDVAQTSQQAFGDSSGALSIKDGKYQTFVVAEDPKQVAAFYEADWQKQGFQQESVVKSGSFDITTLREVYYNGSSKLALVAVGPMDASYIQHIASDTKGLKDMLGKVKAGDTVFVVVSGSK